MGTIPIELLYEPEIPVKNQPEEIGGFKRALELTAMRVAKRDGEYIFSGEEGPIEVYASWPREIRDSRGKSYRWWRFEVYSEQRACPIRGGDDLVMADFPYTNQLVHTAPFRKGYVNYKPDPTTQTFDSVVEAIAWVSSLKRDCFYTKAGAVAALSNPGGMLDPTRARNYYLNSRLVLGVCENFEAFAAEIMKSAPVQKLLKQTNHPIRLGPKVIPIRRDSKKIKKKIYPPPIQLLQEVINEKYSFMSIAIRQSLAGPEIDNDTWLGQPVFNKINFIYLDHLYNCWRRYKNEQRKYSDVGIDNFSDPEIDMESDDF